MSKNWFSNMIPFERPMNYKGIVFHTVENFFQAMKTEKTDLEARAAIASVDPYEAKRMGRRVTLRADWEEIKEDVMLFALKHKFMAGTKAAQRLIATKDEEIVEWNTWHDNYWGHCTCPRCKNKQHLNRLGVLLMQVRDELNK